MESFRHRYRRRAPGRLWLRAQGTFGIFIPRAHAGRARQHARPGKKGNGRRRLRAFAKVAASQGGIDDSPIRDESTYSIGLLGAIEEVIRIGRESGIPVHISHIKALGVDTWGKSKDVIALVRKARAEGIQITADQYPYTASGSSMNASLLPPWSQEGGQARLYERIDAKTLSRFLGCRHEGSTRGPCSPES